MNVKLKELGYDKLAVERIEDIVSLINKLGLRTNEERDKLFNFMISEHFTDNKNDRWIEEPEGPL